MMVPSTSDRMGMSWLLLEPRPDTPMPMEIRAVAASTVSFMRWGMSLPPKVPTTPPATMAAPLMSAPVRIMGSALLR